MIINPLVMCLNQDKSSYSSMRPDNIPQIPNEQSIAATMSPIISDMDAMKTFPL